MIFFIPLSIGDERENLTFNVITNGWLKTGSRGTTTHD